MTDKPEVRGYEVVWPQVGMEPSCIDLWANQTFERTPPQFATSVNPLIRLTDHEASRAADKARIAELAKGADNMLALFADIAKVLGHDFPDCIDNDGHTYQSQYLADLIALAQHGKEGGV